MPSQYWELFHKKKKEKQKLSEDFTIEQAIANQFQVDVSKIDINVYSKMFLTNEDKVKLCLENNMKHLEKRKEWLTPLGLLLTLIATLITTSFKDMLGVNAETWLALFIFGAILSAILLVKSLYNRPKKKTIEDLISEIKGTKPSS